MTGRRAGCGSRDRLQGLGARGASRSCTGELGLTPDASTDRGWAAEMITSAEAFGSGVAAVVAVRGVGHVAELEAHQTRLAKLGEALGEKGNLVRGRQGDGFIFAVENGARVEFIAG